MESARALLDTPPSAKCAEGWTTDFYPVSSYSWRRASTGFMRAARKAGRKPATMPTSARMRKDAIIVLPEARSMMSPSWLAVL